MTIGSQAKGQRRFTTGCMWTLALIFFAGALSLGPARDEDSTPYSDWQLGEFLGLFVISLLFIRPTLRSQTRVNFNAQTIIVWDRLPFILPYRWTSIFLPQFARLNLRFARITTTDVLFWSRFARLGVRRQSFREATRMALLNTASRQRSLQRNWESSCLMWIPKHEP